MGQAFAPQKGSACDACDSLLQDQIREATAMGECRLSDGLDVTRDRNANDAAAFLKCMRINNAETVRERDIYQSNATLERTCPNAGKAGGQGHPRDRGTIPERIVSNRGNSGRKSNQSHLSAWTLENNRLLFITENPSNVAEAQIRS